MTPKVLDLDVDMQIIKDTQLAFMLEGKELAPGEPDPRDNMLRMLIGMSTGG